MLIVELLTTPFWVDWDNSEIHFDDSESYNLKNFFYSKRIELTEDLLVILEELYSPKEFITYLIKLGFAEWIKKKHY